jgi:hypothetical protein
VDKARPGYVASQVIDELADRPTGAGLAQFRRAGGGRLNDEVLVVRTEQAGTASRPPRVQAGQPDLIEAVDHITDGVLVRLGQTCDNQDRAAACRGQQHHRPPEPHRAGTALPHDLLQLLPLLLSQPANPDRLTHPTSPRPLLSLPTSTTSDPANHSGHSTLCRAPGRGAPVVPSPLIQSRQWATRWLSCLSACRSRACAARPQFHSRGRGARWLCYRRCGDCCGGCW